MRYHTTVRTVGELCDALDGVDSDPRLEWGYVPDAAPGDPEVSVEARPSAVIVTVHGPVQTWGER